LTIDRVRCELWSRGGGWTTAGQHTVGSPSCTRMFRYAWLGACTVYLCVQSLCIGGCVCDMLATCRGASAATADRQVALLEQLLQRIDKLESQVTSNAQQQAALGRQQQRLETVTAESLSALRSSNGGVGHFGKR